MTDNEILKVLECCHNGTCSMCPYVDEGYCGRRMISSSLVLIKSQQAEIDRLKTEKDNLIKTYSECQIENIKKFVEQLKEEIQCSIDVGGHYVLYEVITDIDNLVKEMGCGE